MSKNVKKKPKAELDMQAPIEPSPESAMNSYITHDNEPTWDELVTLEIDSRYGYVGDSIPALLRAILRELVLRRIGG